MKSTIKILGIIALVAVIGFSMAACGGGGSGGTFTLTNIPSQYNGKYVFFGGNDGWVSSSKTKPSGIINRDGVLISSGKVSAPLWEFNSTAQFDRYTGNDTFDDCYIYICNSDRLADAAVYAYNVTITFSNGSAARSYNDLGFRVP